MWDEGGTEYSESIEVVAPPISFRTRVAVESGPGRAVGPGTVEMTGRLWFITSDTQYIRGDKLSYLQGNRRYRTFRNGFNENFRASLRLVCGSANYRTTSVLFHNG